MGTTLLLFLKGIAMGAANVIPGVSGGTIAFVTGIYEEFIDSLKAFDLKALKLALGFKIGELIKHLNLAFLIPLFLGVGVSLFSLGKLLDWLFNNYPVFVWSFFFGLILASVYFVSKVIRQRTASAYLTFTLGTIAALALAFLKPAEENPAFFYIAICGIVAVCSMILPGLSGSFVLILMGNYQLVMLQAVPNLDLQIILPFAIGGGIGFIILSRIISYLLHHFHDTTLSALTGFILGSLVVIWPWKNEVHLTDESGVLILKKGEKIVQGYEWFVPAFNSPTTWIAIALMVAGIVAVSLLEKTAQKR
ncbi:conserved domain protein [Verrucomicrobiia bacterium DG1235]|nr:conserved domain protein [Verrucomicrobiae bacterium DG1235]